MRKSWLLGMLVLTFPGSSEALAGSNADVGSYRIQARLGPETIHETVTLELEHGAPSGTLELRLADTLRVLACKVDGEERPFRHENLELGVELQEAPVAGQPRVLEFELEGRPYLKFSQRRGGFVRTDVGRDHAYIRNQYPWYPRIEGDAAYYEITIRARRDWIVRSAGQPTRGPDEPELAVWHFRTEAPERAVGIVAGPYVSVERRIEGRGRIDALVFPGHAEAGGALLEMATSGLEFYSGLYGPVPGGRFTLVEMPEAFGATSGYGEIGYALLGTGAFSEPGGASWAEPLVAHEIAHTWWGRTVGFRHFASESIATYAAHRYMEKKHGPKYAARERRRWVQKSIAVSKVGEVPLGEIRNFGSGLNPAVYAVHAYERGAMVLHMLEWERGRKSADSALERFFAEHRGRVVDYPLLRDELGGDEWGWVFGQWGEPGIPQLRELHRTTREGADFRIRGELHQTGTEKPFRMSVTLRARGDDRSLDRILRVEGPKTDFEFTCPFEPEEIQIDPDGHLLWKPWQANE